jgi:2-methylcitrate dehydratase
VAQRYTDRNDPNWRPATRETADHSIPYCVAAALLDGAVTEASFSGERLRDPRIATLIERTSIREDPAFSRLHPQEWPCRIELTLRGGKKKVAEARYFKGHAKRPLSDEEVERKFLALAGKALGPEQARTVLAKAWALERLAGIGELLDLIRIEKRGRER